MGLLLLLLLQPVADAPLPSLEQRVAALPAVVSAFIARRADCNHWGGEEPYDAARRRAVEAAWADLRCATIDAEERFLRAHFAALPEVGELIDLTADEPGWPPASPAG